LPARRKNSATQRQRTLLYGGEQQGEQSVSNSRRERFSGKEIETLIGLQTSKKCFKAVGGLKPKEEVAPSQIQGLSKNRAWRAKKVRTRRPPWVIKNVLGSGGGNLLGNRTLKLRQTRRVWPGLEGEKFLENGGTGEVVNMTI